MEKQAAEFAKANEISTSSLKMPAVSDYMNYRSFLKDFYAYKRESTKGQLRPYSYAMFSAAANIKSPNYLKMIIEGKRNLSDDMIAKFGKALGLNKEQTEELRLLVHFTQSTDPADRNLFLKKLSEFRVTSKLKAGEIDRKTWEKVPNWVAWIIYAMVDQEAVKFDTKTLKELLRGKAGEDEIDHALTMLLSSGELVKDEVTGEFKKARTLIENAEDIPVALVRKLQAQLMYLGLESLYQDAPTDREFGTLTMSLTKAEFEEVKFKLRQMRKAMNKDNSIARASSKGERVYQLNIQLFPVTNAAPELAHKVKEQKIMASQQIAKVAAENLNKAVKSDVSSLVASAASAADLFR
ncbi:MAG: TIGR02147 family protein [Bdellovibrionia bacterium]